MHRQVYRRRYTLWYNDRIPMDALVPVSTCRACLPHQGKRAPSTPHKRLALPLRSHPYSAPLDLSFSLLPSAPHASLPLSLSVATSFVLPCLSISISISFSHRVAVVASTTTFVYEGPRTAKFSSFYPVRQHRDSYQTFSLSLLLRFPFMTFFLILLFTLCRKFYLEISCY